jgi:hypothetical protein
MFMLIKTLSVCPNNSAKKYIRMVGKQMTEGYFVGLVYVGKRKAARREKETQS